MKKEEIIKLLKETSFEELSKIADEVRKSIHGNIVHLRAIIEFSNYCRCNCLFCGIRRDNKKLKRYRMSSKEIIKTAESAVKEGFKTVVLQSGEDPYWNIFKLSEIVKEIKKFDVTVTLSVGELSYKDYALLREAGADRYLLKFETSDKKLFSSLKPDTTFEKRIQCLKWIKELRYETGSGIMIGLPGQTIQSLVDDIILMKDLEFDMIGIGPFIPHPETPLKNAAVGNPLISLKVLAIIRILLPEANIPATTALRTISPKLCEKAFQAGANVVMLDITPKKYKKLYEIYPGKGQIKSAYNDWQNFFQKIGMNIA